MFIRNLFCRSVAKRIKLLYNESDEEHSGLLTKMTRKGKPKKVGRPRKVPENGQSKPNEKREMNTSRPEHLKNIVITQMLVLNCS